MKLEVGNFMVFDCIDISRPFFFFRQDMFRFKPLRIDCSTIKTSKIRNFYHFIMPVLNSFLLFESGCSEEQNPGPVKAGSVSGYLVGG